ncbi:MAG: dihydropteroate synthase [Gammaproteobacteria bacterium]|jgi:dihydropteroate synthase
MSKVYYQPILHSTGPRSFDAVSLGWCWFDRVAVLRRGTAPQFVAATDVPADVLRRMTQPRAPIAGLTMDQPRIMAILNVTPDSFSDGGLFENPDVAVSHALAMVQAGADMLDIGGESTRPGAKVVGNADEIVRTVPVIAAIRTQSDVPISIDTRKAEVAQAALNAGASLVNDVAAMTYDAAIGSVAAEAGVPICLMHAQGDPATMQDAPTYDNVLLDVYDFLAARVAEAEALGIARDLIVVDPGIGFGKTLEHNLTLMRGLSLFHGLGCPILLGASRKRFIGTIGHALEAPDRMAGSVAVALHGVAAGVQLLRVHDTLETKQAIRLALAMTTKVTDT